MSGGLRSCDVTDELEKDDIPLSSLVHKKKKKGGKRESFELKKGEKKKRSRVISSDTESDKKKETSDDDLVVNVAKKNSVDSRKKRKRSRSEEGEIGEKEVKRSRLDIFEYNEDDLVDYKTTKKEIENERRSVVVEGKERKRFKTDKKKRLFAEQKRGDDDVSDEEKCEVEEDKSTPSAGSLKEKSKVTRKNHITGKSEDGGDLVVLASKNDPPTRSSSRKTCMAVKAERGDSVVLADKNDPPAGSSSRKTRMAVKAESSDSLVVVGKKRKVGKLEKISDQSEAEEKMSSRSAGNSIGKRTHSSVKSEKNLESPGASTMTEKNKSPKRLPTKKSKKLRVGRPKNNTSLQPESESMGTYTSKKKERNKGKEASSTKLSLSAKSPPKRKVNRDKELIRDQIRRMVESAGWKIEYRPRKSKDYEDAVYVDHAGHGYWSILKAYYALQKQYENKESDQMDCGTRFSFTPIPKETLGKLTRLTKRKIERENTIKRKDEKGNKKVNETTKKNSADKKHVKKSKGSSMNREKLSSLIRKDGNSLKVGLKKIGFNLKRKNGVKRPASTPNSDKVGSGVHNGTPNLPEARKSKTQRGNALLVRKSDKEVNSDGDCFIAYPGKRTVLSWLVDSGIISLGGKVKYINKRGTRALLEGSITMDGINCGCCSEIVTISEFETHAGSKLHQPYQNIFVESGVPLFQCQIDAWNKLEESERSGYHCVDISSDDPNDDTCGICGDGGDLICCDGCPSTFHQSCLAVQVIPNGDWHCFNCCCKFCGVVGCSNGQGDDATISRLLTCSLCEEKYHGSCILQSFAVPVVSDIFCSSFCGQKCRELFEQLQKLLGVKHELEEGFSWTLIQRSDLESDTSLCGLPQKVECNSKLALALSLMDECFLPTIDERTGINLIHNVVYNCGSNFNRMNYSGFYTFILERGDEMIAAASVRIHGNRFAEMPFIGTRHMYRRQGMCRRLLNAIESSLSFLNVEKLIIPAISELLDTWTIVFGFSPLEESYKHEARSSNILVFPRIDLLQKLLLGHSSAEAISTDGSVLKAIELERDHQITVEAAENSDTGSVKPDKLASVDANGIIEKVVIAKIGLQTLSLVQDTSDASNPSDVPGELISHALEPDILACDVTVVHHSNGIIDKDAITKTGLQTPGLVQDTSDASNPSDVPGELKSHAPEEDAVMDGVESDLCSLTETSSLHTTGVPNECLDLHPPEKGRGTECSNSQLRDKSPISTAQTTALLPGTENEPHSSVESSAHDSVEGTVNGVLEVNILIDGVESAVQLLAGVSVQHTTDALKMRLGMHSTKEETECHSSKSQDESSILEAEYEPVKSSFVESSGHDSVKGAEENVEDSSSTIDGVESDLHPSADICAQHTTNVLHECLDMHSPPKETEGYNSRSQDGSSVLANEAESLRAVAGNKPTMDSSTEPNFQACEEGAVGDAQELNMKMDDVESHLQSLAETSAKCTNDALSVSLNTVTSSLCLGSNSKFDLDSSCQNIAGMESKSLEVSLVESHATQCETITNIASDVAIEFFVGKKPTVKSSTEPYLKACTKGAVDDTQEVNRKVHCVEPDILSSAEISAQCTKEVLNATEIECCKFQSREESSIEPNIKACTKGVVDAQDLNLKTDSAEPDIQSLADTSAQCTLNVLSAMETDCCNCESLVDSSILGNETESVRLVAENKPTMNSSAEHNLQAWTEAAVTYAQEVNMKVDGVEPDFKSIAETSCERTTLVPYLSLNTVSGSMCLESNSKLNSDSIRQDVVGVESKTFEVSHATHCKEITSNASGEAIKHWEVKTVVATCESESVLHHSTDTVIKIQVATTTLNFQDHGKNVKCHGSEVSQQPLKTDLKCKEESLSCQDIQLLQKTEIDLNTFDAVSSLSEFKNQVAVTERNPRSLGDDSMSCASAVIDKSRTAVIKCNCIASAACKNHDFLSNSCNSSFEGADLHTSETAYENTHDVADELLVALPGSSNLQDSEVPGCVCETVENVTSKESECIVKHLC